MAAIAPPDGGAEPAKVSPSALASRGEDRDRSRGMHRARAARASRCTPRSNRRCRGALPVWPPCPPQNWPSEAIQDLSSPQPPAKRWPRPALGALRCSIDRRGQAVDDDRCEEKSLGGSADLHDPLRTFQADRPTVDPVFDRLDTRNRTPREKFQYPVPVVRRPVR